jgi:hypothetical protein
MSMTRCPLDKGTLGQYYFPLSEVDTIVSHYTTSYVATSALKIPDMVSPQRTLRYPYNKVQGPPIIVGWTMMVSTTLIWGVEPTTSSLGAMSPYHQAKARGAFGKPTYLLMPKFLGGCHYNEEVISQHLKNI